MAKIFKGNYKKLKKAGKELINKTSKKENRKNIIMGADLSGKSTGISIIDENDNLIFMDKIYVSNFNSTPLNLKIAIFALGIQTIVDKYKPSIAIVEDIFSKNINTHSTLARIHGIFLYLMMLNNIKVYYIHPSSAKAFIKCKTKEAVFEKLTKMYGLKLDFKENNDGVDSLLMALNHKNKDKLKEV